MLAHLFPCALVVCCIEASNVSLMRWCVLRFRHVKRKIETKRTLEGVFQILRSYNLGVSTIQSLISCQFSCI